jgi:hypothetical protein
MYVQNATLKRLPVCLHSKESQGCLTITSHWIEFAIRIQIGKKWF